MVKNPYPFLLYRPPPGIALPACIDVPHAGSALPPDFLFSATDRNRSLLRDFDVDRVVATAPNHGVPVLINPYDRIVIDLNSKLKKRDGTPPPRQGLGLISTHLADEHGHLHPLFNEATRPTPEDIDWRIHNHYRPYYAALASLMGESVRKSGFALHFNFHSSPRLTFLDKIRIGDIILSNRDGSTCSPAVTHFALDFFTAENLDVRINDLFKGGALIQTIGIPAQGRHSLQIELARDLYMEPDNLTPDPEKMLAIQTMISRFCVALGSFTQTHAATLCPPKP